MKTGIEESGTEKDSGYTSKIPKQINSKALRVCTNVWVGVRGPRGLDGGLLKRDRGSELSRTSQERRVAGKQYTQIYHVP